jgi:hypothetical protein
MRVYHCLNPFEFMSSPGVEPDSAVIRETRDAVKALAASSRSIEWLLAILTFVVIVLTILTWLRR